MNTRKRLTTSSISGVLILGMWMIPALASTNTSSGKTNPSKVNLTSIQAIQMVKMLFPDLSHMNVIPNATLQKDMNNSKRLIYQISWNSYAVGASSGPSLNQKNAFVTMDANSGQVLSYQYVNGSWNFSPAINETQALNSAQKWVKILAPGYVDKLRLVPLSPAINGGYSFEFANKVNGIWALFDNAQVNISPSGKLIYYSFSWHHVHFPKVPTTVLSQTKALADYTKALNLKLVYQQQSFSGITGNPILIYQPNQVLMNPSLLSTQLPYLNALTGQVLGINGKPLSLNINGTYQPLVKGGSKDWPISVRQVSQTVLATEIQKELSLNPKQWSYTGASTSVQGNYPFLGHSIWQFNYLNKQSNVQLNITVNPADGIINQYNLYPTTTPVVGKSAPTKAEMQQTADQFVEKIFPNLTGAIIKLPQSFNLNNQGQNSFSYAFLIHGVPISAFQVIVNNTTNQVVSYFLFADPTASYPSPTQALSLQTATNAYLANNPMTLQYILPMILTIGNNNLNQVLYSHQAQLIYSGLFSMNSPGVLNALTGKWVVNNSLLSTNSGVYTPSLNSSTLQQAVAALETHGIIRVSGNKLHLSSPISRAQFVSWLARAYNVNISESPAPQFPDVPSSNPYYSSISMALTQGWLPGSGNFYPNKPLTRMQAAVWLIDWMRWNEPASLSNLFKNSIQDISTVPAVDQGSVSIAVDTKMIPLIGENFVPNESMTQGQAAVAIYKAIQALIQAGQ